MTNEEIGIPSSEDVTIVMQANPVTLGADTIVNAEFKTTDLESTMASDTIEISYTGTDALEVSGSCSVFGREGIKGLFWRDHYRN